MNRFRNVLVLAAHLAPTCPAPGNLCLANKTLRNRPGELRPNLCLVKLRVLDLVAWVRLVNLLDSSLSFLILIVTLIVLTLIRIALSGSLMLCSNGLVLCL